MTLPVTGSSKQKKSVKQTPVALALPVVAAEDLLDVNSALNDTSLSGKKAGGLLLSKESNGGYDLVTPTGPNSTDSWEYVGARSNSVSSLLALQETKARFDLDTVRLVSYHDGWAATARGPVGGGDMVWSASSTATPAGAVVVQVTGVAVGRWLMQLDGFVTPEMFGARGSGFLDDIEPIDLAAAYCVISNKTLLFISQYLISRRFTAPAGLSMKGISRDGTSITVTSNDRCIVLTGDNEIKSLFLSAGGNHTGEPKLSVLQVNDNCKGDDLKISAGYTNLAFSGSGSNFSNVISTDADSRGVIFGENSSGNSLLKYVSVNCYNAGALFGQGANNNKLSFFTISGTTLNAIWFIDGAHDNVVTEGTVKDPATGLAQTIIFAQGAYDNTVSKIKSYGYRRAVLFEAGPSLTAFPEKQDLRGNKVCDSEFTGIKESSSVHAVTFGRSTATKVGEIALKNCSFSNFYGVFENDNNSVDGAEIRSIKTSDIGAGGVIDSLRGVGSIQASGIEGVPLSFNFLTDSFAIDSTGTKTIVLPHGLPYTPKLSSIFVGLQRVTAVEDFRIDSLWPVASTDLAITVRARVGSASATAGAVAKMNIGYSIADNEYFDLSAINQ